MLTSIEDDDWGFDFEFAAMVIYAHLQMAIAKAIRTAYVPQSELRNCVVGLGFMRENQRLSISGKDFYSLSLV
jgi:hypothetical protein